MQKKQYIIGTRGSLLALTQCGQIKDQLENLTNSEYSLNIIKTQGDMNTSIPLWQMDGKDFFTKELDEALTSSKVDLVVHSYKDLGSERPDSIKLAAITKRQFAHDILLIKKETIANIKNIKTFEVGTSSPRRIYNIEKDLSNYIPNGNNMKIEAKMLRGNVNTRIQKLKDDKYHAIVLALPGIERLALTHESKVTLTGLLSDMTFMILPQSVFPSAASQGALGVEYSPNTKDASELFKKLQKLEDKDTVSEVTRERAAFQKYGGGCHLAVGINVRKVADGFLHIEKGIVDQKAISKTFFEYNRERPRSSSFFIGVPKAKNTDSTLCDELIEKKPLTIEENSSCQNLIVTSGHCTEAVYKNSKFKFDQLWTSGTTTMQALAKEGMWVNGTSDSTGEVELARLFDSLAIQLMAGNNTNNLILTNDQAESKLGKTIPCYTREICKTSSTYDEQIMACQVFYWTSFFQYEAFVNKYPTIKDKQHCTGLGKTWDKFKQKNISVIPFYNIDEFKAWSTT